MATSKKKKSFEEWYEENYGGKDEEKEVSVPEIAPPTQSATSVFSDKKTKPVGTADIAPPVNGAEQLRQQREAAEHEQRKGLINKGNAFSDGYQFGDWMKTSLASTADAIISAGEGIGGLVEGVTDLAAYGIADWGEKLTPDAEWHKILKEGAMQNTLGNGEAARDLLGINKYSFMGDKPRQFAQTLGQFVGQLAAYELGGPALSKALTFLSSAGGSMTEAYNEGATETEAEIQGAISGIVNLASEGLFDGLGKYAKNLGFGKGLGLDDAAAKLLTDKISNVYVRNILQYGVKSGFEGIEEVIAGSFEALGKKLTYKSEEDLLQLLKDEKLLEQFVMGAFVSGVAQGGDLVSSVQSGTDMVTGESIEDINNANNVVKALTDERIAAEEKGGKTLTAKEKAEIRKDIEQALERGELNTEDIERIIGGDDYKNYKAEMERQEALQKEEKEILDSLRSPDNRLIVTKDSIEKQKRLEELRATKSNPDMVSALKSSLDEKIAKATSSGKLAESYENRARRGQAFKADLSKYKGKALETVRKAVESGILNDTRRTHEMVEFLARISDEKGININFANNEILAKSGFGIKGKQVNGFINEDGITLNANSSKALMKVFGHEITHAFEGNAELYKTLSESLIEYAKTKGEYDSRLKELTEIYKDVKGADVQKELVADLVGDYIFADEKFVRNLYAGNRNIFQKVFDEIKWLYSKATAGSEQEKQLLEVKRLFEKVYREGEAKPVPASEETKLSLARNDELMTAAEKYNDSHFGIDLEQARAQRQAIYDYMTKNAKKLVLPPDVEGDTAFKNSSYDISEENTSVCIRSLAADALCDAVAENLGRPLTVQETLQVSQDLMNYTDEPECVYCYVATDRRAYREFLGSYHKQMTSAIDALKSGKNSEEVYKAFLDGRKDTKNMRNRFAMWEKIAKGGEMISTADLASEKRMQEAMLNPALAPQVKDARAYAQSASWAKKRVGYTAYNGHILKWSQKRVNDLNRHYGLRFYSFSDFSPAFILENMQQITDASVRGLKGLAYTKVLDFVEIFAPTGININISVFGYDQNGTVAEDGMMGANWKVAQDLRAKYENVGITFVATNDAQINWALEQDWIDVVIPYHLVRTGQAVAKHFGYTNYTAESADTKGENWKKGDKKSIYPSEHNNDKQTYLDAIAAAHLEPRFARWVDHPNYMKLVNETRRAANNTPPMRPTFNVDAAKESLERMAQRGGYFVPIGGDYDNMQDIAGEIADNIRANAKFSLSPEADTAYIDAVTRGDTETAQMMVDEAAKVNGYTVKAYHGTKADFTEFSKEKFGSNFGNWSLFGAGFYFAPTESSAKYWGGLSKEDADAKVMPVYLRAENMISANEPFLNDKAIEIVKEEAPTFDNSDVRWTLDRLSRFVDFLINKGYNAKDVRDLFMSMGYDGVDYSTLSAGKYRQYVVFDPNQIKSADAVTYDDNGNVIPLSQRFKSDNNDIRFSLSPETSQGVDRIALENIAPTREQIAAAKRVTTPAKKVDTLPMREDIAPKPKVKMQPSQQVVTTGSNIAPPIVGKERSFAKTAIKSDAVDETVSFDDLSQESTHYVPITNAVTLTKADDNLVRLGYDKAVKHVNAQINSKKVSLEDIALGERLIQEAVRRGDTKTAAELIQNVAILGTELGQKVQALSIIKRLTPAGQLRMLEKVVERGKARGDKAFEGVELTQEMKDEILKTYNHDGSYDQDALNKAVEDVKQRLADKMSVTTMERLNAWRYLAMLGNPKTHIRNIISNAAMMGTTAVKNATAGAVERIARKDPRIKDSRTKTWSKATQSVKTFAENTAIEEKDNITGDGKYSETTSLKDKRKLFRWEVLNKLYGLNNDWLAKEDWWFSKAAYKNSLSNFLTANGIRTADDIKNNPEIVERAKQYAMEQAQIATFRQYSYIASKIGEIERKNTATQIAIGAVLPFKKTPVNIAKTALNYSPLGFAKTLAYDIPQVKKGKMEASEAVDHLAQNLTGTSLMLLGYALAQAGLINGAGDDDKEGKYDYQLGKQAYSINIGGSTYSLSWLAPTAMPLFIGANAYETLVEGQEWTGDVVVEALAQTLDPLSEMSFLSSLDDVLSSYDSGVAKFAGIASSAAQSYVSQYIPTLVSQIATVTDDKKRTTKVASDSNFKFVDETINQLKYKIPGLRQTLEPSTDIWGKTIYQNDDIVGRAVETFIAPYSRKELIGNEIDSEIKDLYNDSGDTGVIPSIPGNTFTYKKQKYEMSEEEYTEYKKVYGRTANILLERLFATNEYQNATAKKKAAMVKKVYDIALDDAKENFLEDRED